MPTPKKRWTVTFRVDSEPIKDEINKFYTDLADQYPDKFTGKGQALYFHMKQGQELIENLGDRPPSKSDQEVLDEVNCYYLECEDDEFKCFDLFKQKKKPNKLGTEADQVIMRCEKCRQGEADEIRKQYQKKLRGQNIKGILQLINLFQKLAQDGVPSTIYFCNRIADNQIFTGLKTITCTLVNAKVSIDKCKELPCEYFEEYSILIEQEFPDQTLKLIEGIAEDYKAIEDLTPRKEIDVEQVDQDVQ